jgi:lipid II:glycine glycyltransferase (peptidoglycan interpeptide bridge formation enzyme)
MRRLPVGGSVGYIARGPVLTSDEPMLLAAVLGAVHTVAREHGVQYLAVQPPQHSPVLERRLLTDGFRPSAREVSPPATVLLDLSQSMESLLSSMNPKTRYNLRLGQRKGIVVREGGEADLGTFYRLLVITGQRHHFSPYPEHYFARMWQVLNPGGHIKLFVAEYAGQPVSALLAIAFGDTVSYKRGGWSGQYGDRHPNELMQWTAITWAKAKGYHYYDFDGVEHRVARALLNGDASARRSVTAFKVGFSDQITLFPRTYDYVYHPLLRWSYRSVYPRIAHWTVVKRVTAALRSS